MVSHCELLIGSRHSPSLNHHDGAVMKAMQRARRTRKVVVLGGRLSGNSIDTAIILANIIIQWPDKLPCAFIAPSWVHSSDIPKIVQMESISERRF